MPVAKVKRDLLTYETVFKNLRRRKISCAVVAVPQKSSSDSTTECDIDSRTICSKSQRKNQPGKRTYRKIDLNVKYLEIKERPKSLPSSNKNSLSEPAKKRTYRKKSLMVAIPKFEDEFNDSSNSKNHLFAAEDTDVREKRSCCRKWNRSEKLCFVGESLKTVKNLSEVSSSTDSEVLKNIPGKKNYHQKTVNINDFEPESHIEDSLSKSRAVNPFSPATAELPKKRAYRKKSLNVEKVILEPKLLGLSPSSSDIDSAFRRSTTETPKKRAYRKKIPAVPHNTPVAPLLYPETSCTSASTLSDLPVKRKRGRPRKNFSVMSQPRPLWEDESTCTTMASSSTLSQESSTVPWRRNHGRHFFGALEPEEKEEEEQEEISEYELQRQKNIEENFKMLKQIFNERGLQFEEKSSETPKIRKSYNKLPLPPPRPKSARIEDRHSLCPLNFSKFRYSLSMD